jgi:2-keto-4-pentenoate hydratase/2-oxohepta-3-ene-1,7-dioic acid hydratase in catechol pathway
MGPWLVTRDEIPDPQHLNLRCRVNGELKQDSNTRHMIFGVATIIARLSRGMTLQPGDIIATGTPSGVGFTREPPEFLRPGDTVTCEIDGIGTLVNSLVAG